MAPSRHTDLKPETYNRLTTIIKTRLNTIKNAVEQIHQQVEPLSSVQINALKVHLSDSNKKKTDFEANLNRVLNYDGEDALAIEVLAQDQDEIDNLYVFISSHIESLIPNEESNMSSVNSCNDSGHNGLNSNVHSQVRLPKIDLPKFNGSLSTWITFINLFDTTIHLNNTLSNVMKFQYLLSVLSGEPLNLIRSLSLTDENYMVAYNLLKERYHNSRRLQLLHLNLLLDLPQISSTQIHGIRQFVSALNENTQALKVLSCDLQDSNPLLTAILLRKMDLDLRKKLEGFRTASSSSINHTLPTVREIISFLNMECSHMEDASLCPIIPNAEINSSHSRQKPSYHNRSSSKKEVSLASLQSSSSTNIPTYSTSLPCVVCNQHAHKMFTCPVFQSKTPQDRYQIVKLHNHCVSCLGPHNIKNCKSQSTCKVCHMRHNTLLHFHTNKVDYPSNNSNVSVGSSKQPSTTTFKDNPPKSESSVTLATQNQSISHSNNVTVLLGTVMIQIRSSDGTSHVFRALLDSGSMCNLITEHAANLLNIRRQKSDIQLSGIEHHVTQNKGQICVTLETLSGKKVAEQQPMVILNKITVDIPRVPLSPDILKYTQSYNLADPSFHIPGRIDIVLGASLFPQLFTNEQFSLGNNLPHVMGTQFGYLIIGNAPCISTMPVSQPTSTLSICLHSISDSDLHSSIQKFWHQEEPPIHVAKSHEEEMCDSHFAATHSRDDSGRYTVRLPFKTSNPSLGTSQNAAELRLFAMERKFKSNTRFSELYHEFMNDYLTLGHMSECNDVDLSQPHYFLPHHGILKESSSTTKLRTVFDASCKTSSGASLNDLLLTGRKLQNNICDLIIHFRCHNIVFCCDIRQMYRQILVHPNDRKFQLIVWRTHPDLSLTNYQLNTVTYGMNSSPYLAIRTLHQLAEDEGLDFPDAARILRNHTYVDDIITGADTETEAVILQQQLISLLNRGGFELRKWVSNSPKLLDNLPDTYLESPKFLENSNIPQFNVLGLQWSPTFDSFSYKVQSPVKCETSTKRSVLSTIAQIYDPCGFLVPFVMLAKCFMQLLWTRGLSWDNPLPHDLYTQWDTFTDNIKLLTNISIPRSLDLSSSCHIELHGFCDASEVGYAAVIYLKCENSNHETSIKLLIAKSSSSIKKSYSATIRVMCSLFAGSTSSSLQNLVP
jgi:hypothetical protein